MNNFNKLKIRSEGRVILLERLQVVLLCQQFHVSSSKT
jgi:hypothetical protein